MLAWLGGVIAGALPGNAGLLPDHRGLRPSSVDLHPLIHEHVVPGSHAVKQCSPLGTAAIPDRRNVLPC